jgi:surface antigen
MGLYMGGKKLIALSLVSALTLSSCAGSPYAQQRSERGIGGLGKTEVGTLIGGGAGALAGAQFGKGKGRLASVAIGTLLGAAVGHEAGASMDRADINYYENTTRRTLETAPVGTTSSWHNPDSGNYGDVTVTRTYQQNNGEYCREFNHKINVGGQWQNGFGTACRMPDGSWEIQS